MLHVKYYYYCQKSEDSSISLNEWRKSTDYYWVDYYWVELSQWYLKWIFLRTFTPEVIGLLLNIYRVSDFKINFVMMPRYEFVQASMRCLEQFQLGERYASASFRMKKQASIDSPRVTPISSKTVLWHGQQFLAFETFPN